MKKWLLFTLVLFIGTLGNAQDNEYTLDIRFGAGTSLLGTGDMQTIMFDNELNIRLSDYFSCSGSLAYAKSDNGVFQQASFVQLNSNVYLSPFKNNGKNDFRLGAGLSWYEVSDVFESSVSFENGEPVSVEYRFDKRNSIGFNLIIENTYAITDKYLIGLKLFTQPYENGDINSGILLKFGVKI